MTLQSLESESWLKLVKPIKPWIVSEFGINLSLLLLLLLALLRAPRCHLARHPSRIRDKNTLGTHPDELTLSSFRIALVSLHSWLSVPSLPGSWSAQSRKGFQKAAKLNCVHMLCSGRGRARADATRTPSGQNGICKNVLGCCRARARSPEACMRLRPCLNFYLLCSFIYATLQTKKDMW